MILLPQHAETRRLVDRVLASASDDKHSIIEVANCQTACTFVEMGVGVAIVHSLCIAHVQSPSVHWIDLDQRLGRVSFSAIYRRGGARSPLIRGLLEELTSG